MAEQQRVYILESIGKQLGVNLFSYDFVRDASYVEDRCGRIIGGGNTDGQSLLRCVLHAGLTNEERERIFPEEFDLGNARSIPDEACTYEALGKELEQQRTPQQTRDNPLEKAAVVRLLRETAALLGHKTPQEQQVGAGQLFKVVKLLHGFKQRPGLLQLMSILRPPAEATASMELTNPYPTGADSELRWHMIDLHDYLSAEISVERLMEIDSTFGNVRAVLDDALNDIAHELGSAGRPSNEEVVLRYQVAMEQWASRRSPPSRKLLRADEQLYLTMHALDFLHFAKVEDKLRRERLLQRSVTPISASAALKHSRIRLSDLCESDIPDSVRQLHPLMSEAIGEDVSNRQFRDILESAHSVLNHWVSLQEVPAREDVDALTALAAVIVARAMRKEPASYKPGLHGSAWGQSLSVKSAFKIDRPVSSTHEEFERIGFYAVEWMRFALSGQTAVFEAHLAFRKRLIDIAVTLLNTHDTEVMATFLSNLEGYAEYGVKGVPGLAAQKKSTMQNGCDSHADL
ncbi:hypothetical protein D3879_22845 [Pseudomonas cavernicola]|uniref:Uncharacterized protein n=1 Tax=Pseudomonas cavernicola TaxID=2320866 RepID=A0A418X8A3_9PSED|nr:hypothetical protein [Pseudomonas cavernicola]RJG08719.1 hypothetical protein D3879_22845 [Pseudomonas cavernicola]